MHTLSKEYFLNAFTEGDSVSISSEELDPVEDVLVHSLLPLGGIVSERVQSHAEINWAHRKRLIDALRGPKYNGRLSDVTIEPMLDPYDLYTDEHPTLARKQSPAAAANTLGFFVCANLVSSLSSDLGKFRRPVWVMRKAPASIIGTGVAWKRTLGKDQGENTIEEAFRLSTQRAGRYGTSGGGHGKHSMHRQTLDDGQHKGL